MSGAEALTTWWMMLMSFLSNFLINVRENRKDNPETLSTLGTQDRQLISSTRTPVGMNTCAHEG